MNKYFKMLLCLCLCCILSLGTYYFVHSYKEVEESFEGQNCETTTRSASKKDLFVLFDEALKNYNSTESSVVIVEKMRGDIKSLKVDIERKITNKENGDSVVQNDVKIWANGFYEHNSYTTKESKALKEKSLCVSEIPVLLDEMTCTVLECFEENDVVYAKLVINQKGYKDFENHLSRAGDSFVHKFKLAVELYKKQKKFKKMSCDMVYDTTQYGFLCLLSGTMEYDFVG